MSSSPPFVQRVPDCPVWLRASAQSLRSPQFDDDTAIDDPAMCRESAPTVDPYAICLKLLDGYLP